VAVPESRSHRVKRKDSDSRSRHAEQMRAII
jgi:hypothetical protein